MSNYAVAIEEKPVKRTRKDHRCCECGRKIPRGSACMSVRGIWADGPDVMRWCLGCDLIKREVRSMLVIGRYDEPLGYGELFDYVSDMT